MSKKGTRRKKKKKQQKFKINTYILVIAVSIVLCLVVFTQHDKLDLNGSSGASVERNTTILTPMKNEVVRDFENITVNFRDDTGDSVIAKRFLLDIVSQETETIERETTNTSEIINLSYNWNSTDFPDGIYMIKAKCWDFQGRWDQDAILVEVDNDKASDSDMSPPQVFIDQPTLNDSLHVGDIVTIQTRATDSSGMSYFALFIDGDLLDLNYSNGTTSAFSWNTEDYEDGAYSIKIRGYDGSLNYNYAEETLGVTLQESVTSDGATTEEKQWRNSALIMLLIFVLIAITIYALTNKKKKKK